MQFTRLQTTIFLLFGAHAARVFIPQSYFVNCKEIQENISTLNFFLSVMSEIRWKSAQDVGNTDADSCLHWNKIPCSPCLMFWEMCSET
jgi:hypothetical protein